MFRSLICGLLVCGMMAPTLRAEEPVKVLMLTQSKGFMHGSVKRTEGQLSPAEVSMIQLGKTTGLFDVTCTQDAEADLTKENLSKYKIVMFYTTGDLPIKPENFDYFMNTWLKTKGNGFIGFHSATDTYKSTQVYWDMIGGTFKGHPWGAGETVTIAVHDTSHPTTKHLGSELVIKDEIYEYVNWQPEKVQVLMSLDMAKCKTKRPYHVPVAWVKNYGEGRVYVNNLGHNPQTWENEAFLKSVVGGVRWILHRDGGDAVNNPELSAKWVEKGKADVEAAAKAAQAAPQPAKVP